MVVGTEKNLVFSTKTRLILGISSVEFFMIIIPNKPHKDLENIGIIVQNYIAVTDMSFWFFSLNFLCHYLFQNVFHNLLSQRIASLYGLNLI